MKEKIIQYVISIALLGILLDSIYELNVLSPDYAIVVFIVLLGLFTLNSYLFTSKKIDLIKKSNTKIFNYKRILIDWEAIIFAAIVILGSFILDAGHSRILFLILALDLILMQVFKYYFLIKNTRPFLAILDDIIYSYNIRTKEIHLKKISDIKITESNIILSNRWNSYSLGLNDLEDVGILLDELRKK